MGFPPIPERAPKSVQNRTFCALFTHFLHKKCGFAHFLALFLESAETPLFVQINVFAVRALRLDRKYTNLGQNLLREWKSWFSLVRISARDLVSAGSIHHVMWSSPAKIWCRKRQNLSRHMTSLSQDFHSCYRTPGPQKGQPKGPSKPLQKAFKNPSKTLPRPAQRPLQKPFWGLRVL